MKCCSVVFGVTLKLLVINILPSFPAVIKHRRLLPAKCHNLTDVVRRRRIYNTWQVAALIAVKPDIGSESRFLPTPPAFDAPVRGFPSEYCHAVSLVHHLHLKVYCNLPCVVMSLKLVSDDEIVVVY